MQSPPALILASTSRYRRALLERLGLSFECRAPEVDERPQAGEPAAVLAPRLARAKAAAIASSAPDAWVIGSDQVARLEDAGGAERLLGKPGTRERCIEQLLASSARSVEFLTAVCVLRGRDQASHAFVDHTRVRFRTLERASVERYVDRESPLDCAGGFKCEGLGITLFESIENHDPTALVGLPLIGLAQALRACGYLLP
ncbi:MAG: septum formation protein Maf [Betaproteobacteria bacterium]|nr:septum formation protein Maf [Betaproteobacteria bacterium]